MADESLQAAFEIKTVCDEISRKLLRWHWEQKPGAHSFDSLLDHIAQRQQESPSYYDRMPELENKTNWNQLDTTLCMRVLLDPEKDASHPLDLLGATPYPSAARRACNAVRTARNEAAHASDDTAGTQAAILFNEAVESLEAGYADTALKPSELEKYYRMAEDFLARCGAKKPVASASAREERPARNTSGRKNTTRSTSNRSRTGERSSSSRSNTAKRSNSRSNARSRAKKKKQQRSRNVLFLLLALLAVGLLIRWFTMG